MCYVRRGAALSPSVVLVKDEACVGAAEAERVRHDALHRHLLAFPQYVHALRLGDELFDVGRLGEEAIAHHEQRVDRLVHAGGAQRVPRQRLRRADVRLVARLGEDGLDGVELLEIAHRRRGAVSVDIVDLLLAANLVCHLHRQPHAVLAADPRRRHHVVPVRVGRVPDQLAVYLGATRLGVLELFEHDDAAAACNDEAVARDVERARRRRGIVVVLGGERRHRVEHD
mmetsp:Transcript_18512/g.59481  ORF Transcript_18512/g.59481 Transcript_18512/m.59481 type:complete len:228 (+) Transcript_18512:185-868(+)